MEGVERDVAGFGGELEEFIDFLSCVSGSGGEDNVMGGIDHLGLFPGMREELFAQVGISDDEEAIGLESEGGGGQDEGCFDGVPCLGGDFAGPIEDLGGIAPMEVAEQLLVRNELSFHD